MKKNLAVALVAIALLALGAFLVLRGKGAPGLTRSVEPAEVVPASVRAAFVVPDLGKLGDKLAFLPKLQLANFAASVFFGSADAEQFVTNLNREIGFDVRSRDSIKAAGIDPSRPVLFAQPTVGPNLGVVPVVDAAKLEALLAKHVAARLSATERAEQRAPGGERIATFTVPRAPGPAVCVAQLGTYAVIATGDGALDAVKAALARKKEQSLASDEHFEAAKKNFEGDELFAYLPSTTLATAAANLAYGASFGLSLNPKDVRVRGVVPLSDAQQQQLGSLAAPAGRELLGKLDQDSFLAARVGGDPTLVAPFVSGMLPRGYEKVLSDAGIDIARDILANLQPGFVVGLSLAPSAQLGAGVPDLDPRRTNPFQFVYLAGLGKAKDPAKARETLGKLADVMPRFRADVDKKELDGDPLYTVRYHLGEGASLSAKGDYVLVSGGPGRMEVLRKRVDEKPAPLEVADAAGRRALEEDGAAVFFDVARLVASIRALPDSAYGVGGFAIKAAVTRWLDAISEIKALRVGVKAEQQAVRIDLGLSLEPAPAAAPAPGQAEKAP